ncbi:hypothetical protein D9M68_711570 [compost metagenome]
MLAQAAAVALGALHGARVELGGHEGDAFAPALHQVLGDGMAGLDLREAHAIHIGRLRELHQIHTGHTAGGDHLARGFGAVKTREQQTGRAVREVAAQQLFFFLRLVVRHANHGLVAVGQQRAVHRFEHVHKQGVGQQGNEHRHLRAALRSEGARGRVGHIAELRGGTLDALHQIGGHAPLAAQRARRSDGADFGGLRHVAEGGAPAVAALAFSRFQGFSRYLWVASWR